jgi:endoglucanase
VGVHVPIVGPELWIGGCLCRGQPRIEGYNDTLAVECLATARRIWTEEHSHAPDTFRHGNTTGGPLDAEELKAVVELLVSTGDAEYKDALLKLLSGIERQFERDAVWAVKALPYMDAGYQGRVQALVRRYKERMDQVEKQNPYGMPITTGG